MIINRKSMTAENYFPPPEKEGGWYKENPQILGIDIDKLNNAVLYHTNHEELTKSYGGALVIIYKGKLIYENYTTGVKGGPQPWTPTTCNDMCSSTKSVFGTAVGVFLEEFKDQINLETNLIGTSREDSLIPQIWDQPLTDERKKAIKIKHALSMTSGLATEEPWTAPSPRHFYPSYSGAYQMFEYCFGWWYFEGIPSNKSLLFEPGSGFNYSNYGLEQLALAMRNLTGEELGPYIYDRVLKPIGMPIKIRENRYGIIPVLDGKNLNYSNTPGWGIGGSKGCDAYGGDKNSSPYGYNDITGSAFTCSARDFARLGYLWLREGRWEDQQLVPKAWLQKATQRFERDNKETPVEYGYTFWILDDWEEVPDDAYMSRGFNLNDCYVVPSLDLVVVRQGNENKEGRPHFSKTLLQKIVAAIQ